LAFGVFATLTGANVNASKEKKVRNRVIFTSHETMVDEQSGRTALAAPPTFFPFPFSFFIVSPGFSCPQMKRKKEEGRVFSA
jgi:hypothetical protein